MTYKIKSFLYFLCFAIAAFIYNNIQEEDERFKNQVNSTTVVETDFEDTDSREKAEEDRVKDLE